MVKPSGPARGLWIEIPKIRRTANGETVGPREGPVD